MEKRVLLLLLLLLLLWELTVGRMGYEHRIG